MKDAGESCADGPIGILWAFPGPSVPDERVDSVSAKRWPGFNCRRTHFRRGRAVRSSGGLLWTSLIIAWYHLCLARPLRVDAGTRRAALSWNFACKLPRSIAASTTSYFLHEEQAVADSSISSESMWKSELVDRLAVLYRVMEMPRKGKRTDYSLSVSKHMAGQRITASRIHRETAGRQISQAASW